MRRIATARGVYLLQLASELEPASDAIGLTVALERADGIEKVTLRCIIPPTLLSDEERADPAKIEPRLEEWLALGFEQIREAALKSIRSERRLWEARFLDSPGPWRTAKA